MLKSVLKCEFIILYCVISDSSHEWINLFLCERLESKYNDFTLTGHDICCIPVLLTRLRQESVFFFNT